MLLLAKTNSYLDFNFFRPVLLPWSLVFSRKAKSSCRSSCCFLSEIELVSRDGGDSMFNGFYSRVHYLSAHFEPDVEKCCEARYTKGRYRKD